MNPNQTFCPVCGCFKDVNGFPFYGNKITYIKHLRLCFPRLGLKECKDMADLVFAAQEERRELSITVSELDYIIGRLKADDKTLGVLPGRLLAYLENKRRF